MNSKEKLTVLATNREDSSVQYFINLKYHINRDILWFNLIIVKKKKVR